MQALVDLTFTSRMQGPQLAADQTDALNDWLVKLPPLVATATDATAIHRGKAVFESSEARCSTCHAGTALTNNATLDVSTGGTFQVPSLVNIGFRAPYFTPTRFG